MINLAGTYRGSVVDRAVNTSSGGFPQFVAKLQADEIYDREVGEFVALETSDDITAYLILYDSRDKECLAVGQIQKVLGWDGVSFSELNELDCLESPLQFRVKESLYNDKINYQVEWIDDYDAVPGAVIKKLDAAGLKALDARYHSKMKKAAPASAPKTKPKPIVSTPPAPITREADEVKKTPVEDDGTTPEATMTKDAAWARVYQTKDKKIKDAKLIKIWNDKIRFVAGTKTDEEITDEEWHKIAVSVHAETGVVPF